ncbi:hypothetical protein SCUCBS95973_001125 [Sporothrix curviconia]|uniref:Uncharacterized protein n=1 Tax=Sporothrix curviconia TaxID=1260050 RepID=A0ABP0AW19_9PEZI
MAPLSAVLRSGFIVLLTCTAADSSLPQPRHASSSSSSSSSRTADTVTQPPLAQSEAAVRRNAFSIFNAVHSAMRQWGSSLNHNGMSLMLATVPEGQLFYHGGPEADRPRGIDGTGFDWLAFELEHAQMFARARGGGQSHTKVPDDDSDDDEDGNAWGWDITDSHYDRQSYFWTLADAQHDQKKLESDEDDDKDSDQPQNPRRPVYHYGPRSGPVARGYLHTYRANRPLNLLYIDGMAAGKTGYGCLDSQDLLLLDWNRDDRKYHKGDGWGGEVDRAGGLCDLAKEWAWDDGQGGGRIDGFIRTEAGFEIIYCDFSAAGGLDVVSIQPTPFANQTGGLPEFVEAEFLRGVALRYHGFPAGRIHMDWSSMVSAFFYDVNLTNPDPSRPELPRLSNTTRSERQGIRSRLQEVVAARGRFAPHHGKSVVDWQGIVDLVVTRFSHRLDQLVRGTLVPITNLASRMLPTLIYSYVNYADPEEPRALQMERCTQHYLAGALAMQNAWTPEDKSIYLAVETVTNAICKALFDIHTVVYNETANDAVGSTGEEAAAGAEEEQKDEEIYRIVQNLMGKLQWTTWRECDPCKHPDEMCLVAMFPWGDDEDHFHPQCKVVDGRRSSNNYWWNGRGR